MSDGEGKKPACRTWTITASANIPEYGPIVTMYMAQTYGKPFIPGGVYAYMAPHPDAPFVPYPMPSIPDGTQQEIGALKERVGRLEREMREMTERFLAKRRAKK